MITRILPIGSSVYLMLLFIEFLSFPPIPCTDNPDPVSPIRKANCHDRITYLANAVVPPFALAVSDILRDDTVRIAKRILRERE